jgi:hypothetical protein
MQERFWLVLAILGILVMVSFFSVGTRGVPHHGEAANIVDRVAALPNRLLSGMREMGESLAELMTGSPQSTPPVAAADAPGKRSDPPARQ